MANTTKTTAPDTLPQEVRETLEWAIAHGWAFLYLPQERPIKGLLVNLPPKEAENR